MAKRRELLYFKQGMIVRVQGIGHSIAETVWIFDNLQSTVPSVYQEYLITARDGQRIGRPQIFSDRHQRRLLRIVCSNRQMALSQIILTFNVKGDIGISDL